MAGLKLKKNLKPLRGIELAPLIDVISFIVIYFLMNATLEKGSVIKIQLPKSSSVAREKRSDQIVISVDEKGEVFFEKDTEPVKIEEIREKINLYLGPEEERKTKNPQVIIRADGKADYQKVIRVIDEVNASGIKRFNLAMTQKRNSN